GKDVRINQVGSNPVLKQTLPSKVSNISSSEVGISSFRLSWKNITGSSRYDITIHNKTFHTNDTSLLVSSLNPGSVYDVTIVAIGEENNYGETSATYTIHTYQILLNNQMSVMCQQQVHLFTGKIFK
uniref:Fibronectin type-III domain-containing protein n=1 Tax=Ciona intestinalis TaxID=7719 RepID=H2XZD6_CIOIN